MFKLKTLNFTLKLITYECQTDLLGFLRHCPGPSLTFTKRLLLEKHIQLMHGIKDTEAKLPADSSSAEATPDKEQVTNGLARLGLYSLALLQKH